jgi:hypothetical protein
LAFKIIIFFFKKTPSLLFKNVNIFKFSNRYFFKIISQ